MFALQPRADLGGGSGNQNILRLRQQSSRDGRNLIGSFPRSENNFRHAVAKSAVMIDLRESEILEGKMPHALHSGVDAGRSSADIFEQRAQLILVHTLRE